MDTSPLEVIVRCKNEMPWVIRTLDCLVRLRLDVTVIDSGSTDGSVEGAERAGVRVVRIPPESYVPGRVLGDAMRRTKGDVVAFVNADAIPLREDAVERLARACREGAAAAYGRQLPRPSARPATKIDYARCFPDDPRGPGFRHFFSMAASAIRRDAWAMLPFDDDLKYSEDIDWTWRLKALGQRIEYVPEAEFEHSHDYDTRAMHKRMLGEGQAHAAIFRVGRETVSRGFLAPLAKEVVRDVLRHGSVGQVGLRVAAQVGRFRGRGRSVAVPSGPGREGPHQYTLGGEPEGEAAVQRAVTSALAALAESPVASASAILLLGGFACGEGAVERTDGGLRLHNDLDIVAVVDTRREAARLREACHAAGERATALAGVSVDVWPASREEIARPEGRFLWIDAAVRGVRVLRGDSSVVEPLRAFRARDVRADELGRLLANRATGLALSRLKLEAGVFDPHAARHVAKGWLSLGDALLLHVDRYAPGLQERAERLASLARGGAPLVKTIEAGYAKGVAFRHRPNERSVDREELVAEAKAQWNALASLEAHRLGAGTFETPWAYAASKKPVFEALDDVRPIARVMGGVRAAAARRIGWRAAHRHPREALARASVLLAYADDRGAALAWARRTLNARTDSASDVRTALERLREVAA